MSRYVMTWPLLLLLLGGCVSYNAAPRYVKCKGKGTVNVTGGLAGAAIYGGGGLGAYTLSVDCGDGLEFDQNAVPPAEPPAR